MSSESDLVTVDRIQNVDYLPEKMNNLYQNKQLTDVVLIAENDKTKIFAHRNVLSRRNNYFRTLLQNSFYKPNKLEFIIQEVSGTVLENLITYCYTGEIQLNYDNCKILMITAMRFHFDAVVETCTTFLISQIEQKNCIGIWAFAKKYNFKRLKIKAIHRAQRDVYQFYENPEVLELDFHLFQELITTRDMDVKYIYRAIISWIYYNQPERLVYLNDLLSQIPLDFFKDPIHSDPVYIANNMERMYMFVMNDDFFKTTIYIIKKRLASHENCLAIKK